MLGASPRAGSIGGELFRNIVEGGFAGAAYPVNRNGEPVAGIAGYASIEQVPERVDLAVVCLPAETVLEAAERRSAWAYARSAWSRPASPSSGTRARSARTELLALVRTHGARLVGPNCLGVIVSSRPRA